MTDNECGVKIVGRVCVVIAIIAICTMIHSVNEDDIQAKENLQFAKLGCQQVEYRNGSFINVRWDCSNACQEKI